MAITLHGSPLSPFVRKTLVAFDEKNLSYQHEEVIPFPKTPELLARSPLGRIPFLEVDGTFIPDSTAILTWLEAAHPSPALYPADPVERGRTAWFEEYGDTQVTNTCATPFFQRFVRPNIFQEEADEERVAEAMTSELPPILDYLTEQLGEADYMVGGAFTAADIALCSSFANMRLGGEEIDAGRWPRVAAYVERIFSRPSFKSALAKLPQ